MSCILGSFTNEFVPGDPTMSSIQLRRFAALCVLGAVLLIAGEVFDGLFPQIGNTAPQTFDPLDLIASVGGAVGAYALYHLLTAFPIPSEIRS